jgi:hypothetical protein
MTIRQARTGRRCYRSRVEAEQLAAEFEASGLSRQEFCERNDVAVNTLARYIRRYKRKSEASGRQQWVAVDVTGQSPPSTELSVVVPGGRRIEVRQGFDTATLQQLIAALERIG